MTQQEIIEMATKVYGECDWHESALHHLEAFAKLVDAKATAHEREACAKVCDELSKKHSWEGCYANECAEEIRARGNA